MSASASSSPDFSDGFLALIAYYRGGNMQTFFSALDKALAYAKLDLSLSELKSARRLMYNRLQLFGICESTAVRGERRWSAGPNRLIYMPNARVLPFGDSAFVCQVGAALGSTSTRHVYYTFPRSAAGLVLSSTYFTIDEGDFEKIVRELGCWGINIDVQALAEILPPLEDVYLTLCTPGTDPTKIDTSVDLKRFDEALGDWTQATSEDLSPGLYRIPHVFGVHRDMVVLKGARSLIGFDVRDRDWTLILGAHLLRQELNWTYSFCTKTLSLPDWQISLLPMLLKRVLCAASLTWPSLESSKYVFNRLEPQTLNIIEKKYPVIKVNYVH